LNFGESGREPRHSKMGCAAERVQRTDRLRWREIVIGTMAARRFSIYSQVMIRPTYLLLTASLIAGIFVRCDVARAQATAPTPAAGTAPAAKSAAGVDFAASAAQGIGFAEKGRCREALPLLKKAIPHLADKQLKFEAAMASARCAMSLDQVETTVDALLLLNREYPHNPEVLYVTIHYFSELANRSEQDLVSSAPGSYQAHKLDAEGLESQEKWDEAAAEYRKILDENPKLPDIHYRLGRILLSKQPPAVDEAKQEFDAELAIDPNNSAAEFMLGDMARQAQQWDEASEHFSRALKMDAGFEEAYLGLGMALNAAGKNSQAVGPLESYVKMEPADPAGHYQLSIAYAKLGRKDDAAREMALQREAEIKAQAREGSGRPQ
jgi:tetratricopeptide (TPR) repeat protein